MIKSTERHFGANLLGHCNQCNTNDRNALELVILVQVCLDIRCATNSSVVWTDIIQQRASKHTYTTGMKQLLDLEHVSSSSIRAGLDCLQTILAGCFIFQGANNLKSDFAITLSTCRARERGRGGGENSISFTASLGLQDVVVQQRFIPKYNRPRPSNKKRVCVVSMVDCLTCKMVRIASAISEFPVPMKIKPSDNAVNASTSRSLSSLAMIGPSTSWWISSCALPAYA
jgi:hypothetical protein